MASVIAAASGAPANAGAPVPSTTSASADVVVVVVGGDDPDQIEAVQLPKQYLRLGGRVEQQGVVVVGQQVGVVVHRSDGRLGQPYTLSDQHGS